MKPDSSDKSPHSPHSHKFTIADDEAVEVFIEKLKRSGVGDEHLSKLRQGLETAMEECQGTTDLERKAFFHGMLAGYGVALKLGQQSKAA